MSALMLILLGSNDKADEHSKQVMELLTQGVQLEEDTMKKKGGKKKNARRRTGGEKFKMV